MASFLISIILVSLLVNVYFYIQQPLMVYYPIRTLDSTPKNWGYEFEDITLTTEDKININAWYIKSPSAKKVVLFCHGNAGNMSHRRSSVEIFRDLNLSVLIFDYRGYGKSEGNPTEEGTYRDARAAWKYLVTQRHIDPHNIIIFGRSLGGAVAARLASEVEAGGLIIESTFSSARDMAKQVLPVMHRLVRLRFRYETVRHVKNSKIPILVMHSREDEIIPYAQGRKIFSAASGSKTFVELKGDHNNGFYDSGQIYIGGLKTFLAGID
ncbi:MAG: lysophospholipase [Gammaproteobacteria bacterium]|nr:lysophospholipase [Gammaproteobacteria bacterium]